MTGGNEPPAYLTPLELSRRWKNMISPGTLANWRANRKGPAYVKMGGRVLYPVQAVEQWERSRPSGGSME